MTTVWPLRCVLVILGVWVALSACPCSSASPRPDPFKEIANSTDVSFLEKVAGSLAEAAALSPAGGLARHAKDLRTAAYARLGELGTPESLAAAKRIEDAARKVIPATDPVRLDQRPHPAWHFGDPAGKPVVECTAADGTTYGLLMDPMFGDMDFLLITRPPTLTATGDKGAFWARPRLLPLVWHNGLKDLKIEVTPQGELAISFTQEKPGPVDIMDSGAASATKAPQPGPHVARFSLAEINKDSDGDGWTDLEEARLGLDPNKADTDGDGVPDGQDICPDFTPAEDAPADEEVQILQKAFFATFGLSGSRYVLLAQPKCKPVRFWGYGGPLLYKQDRAAWQKAHGLGAVWVMWEVTKKSATEAEVSIHDYEAPLAAGSQTVRLCKIGSEWFVVRREIGWVS